MPHIIFEKKGLVKTPIKQGNIEFLFTAVSSDTEKNKKISYKIAVKNQDKEFLLTIKDKNENLIIKSDKTTRISPITLIKDALNSYISLNKSKTIISNTNSLKLNKEKQEYKYLKDINYFVYEFQTSKELQIEIGFGSGRHLLYQAKNNPNIQFIGLEIHHPSTEQLLRQLELLNITNVLVVNYDARLFMEFINSNKVGKIFVHFPVPWDRKPHRRIYSNEFINEALRVLKVGGTLELRTDSRKYFDFSIGLLANLNKANISININKNLEISSKYEDRWKEQGKNIYDVIITSQNEDENIDLSYDFSFDFDISFDRFLKIIPLKVIIIKYFFVHIEELYTILNEENSGLIKVTMGNFDKPITKYLLIQNGKISYYQGMPLPTNSNIQAHKKLKEILAK